MKTLVGSVAAAALIVLLAAAGPDDQPTFDDSLVNAERFRLQTDVLVRF